MLFGESGIKEKKESLESSKGHSEVLSLFHTLLHGLCFQSNLRDSFPSLFKGIEFLLQLNYFPEILSLGLPFILWTASSSLSHYFSNNNFNILFKKIKLPPKFCRTRNKCLSDIQKKKGPYRFPELILITTLDRSFTLMRQCQILGSFLGFWNFEL